jgi:hypothetical protein
LFVFDTVASPLLRVAVDTFRQDVLCCLFTLAWVRGIALGEHYGDLQFEWPVVFVFFFAVTLKILFLKTKKKKLACAYPNLCSSRQRRAKQL